MTLNLWEKFSQHGSHKGLWTEASSTLLEQTPGAGMASAAAPGIPTCCRTGAALLDGVVRQLGPFGWEPEQNQRRTPCNQASAHMHTQRSYVTP